MPDAADQERRRHDHTCHATARFAGDPRNGFWWIEVLFSKRTEIDELIRLLRDLRDHPKAQRYHIHLQDWRMCDDTPEQSPPEDVEVIFRAPAFKPEWTDRKALEDGARAMREWWRPSAPIDIEFPRSGPSPNKRDKRKPR